MNRRSLLLTGAGAILSHAAASHTITLGVIGAGGRGTLVMTTFQKSPNVRVGAICDVYEPNLERGLSTAAKAQTSAPKAYRNYKEMLADKNIDAVLIATPEHWHAQMVLDALAAGKDVYVEKPLCRTPEEGVALVEAEKKTKQIIQTGMQRRSYDLYLDGRKLVADGTLGAVRMVRSDRKASRWWRRRRRPNRSSRPECSAEATTCTWMAASWSPTAPSAPCAWCAPIGRRRAGGGGEEDQTDHPDRNAAPKLRPVPGWPQAGRRRHPRRRAHGALRSEGVALVEAEKKTKQIIQTGMQRRSYDLYLDGRKLVADGTLGAVRMVR